MFAANTRILIVDDMSTMRKLVGKSLKELGFSDITEAVDGEEGWKAIQEAQRTGRAFQLIVSDWNMPKLKGIDLLTKVRAYPPVAGTCFILLTAEAERDQVAAALQTGVSGYLLKPFTRDQLAATLSAVYSKLKKAA